MVASITKHSSEEYPYSISYEDRLPDVFVQQGSPYTATTVSVSGATETFLDSANSMPAAIVGDRVTVTGFANAVNNQTFTVLNRTAGLIQVESSPLATENAGASVTLTITRQTLVNSVTVTAEEYVSGLSATATIIDGVGTLDPSGKAIRFTLTGGADGMTYLVKVVAGLSSGAGQQFVDQLLVYVQDRPMKG